MLNNEDITHKFLCQILLKKGLIFFYVNIEVFYSFCNIFMAKHFSIIDNFLFA